MQVLAVASVPNTPIAWRLAPMANRRRRHAQKRRK
jgi:hypothetical protein